MRRSIVLALLLGVVLAVTPALAGPSLIREAMGGASLANAPDYDWWYGCTPTSAGMLAGYYDANGYGARDYGNLVPGGVAEMSSYGNPGAIANDAIASSGHIADFWTGYGNSGDDPLASGRTRPGDFDCLADFMGTSQDSVSSSDGSTWIYNYNDGSKLHYWEMPGHGLADDSGMYGIYEYVVYSGYGSDVTDIYNQYTDNQGLSDGFSFADFMAEIDAGRPMLVHVDGHTMFGYGYNDVGGNAIYVRDTWTAGVHSMTWGGSYSGLEMWGVTVLELNPVPEPTTMLLFGVGILSALGLVRRRRRTA